MAVYQFSNKESRYYCAGLIARLLAATGLRTGCLILLFAWGAHAQPARAQRDEAPVLLDDMVAPGGHILIQGYGFSPGESFRIIQQDADSRTSNDLLTVESDRAGVIGPIRAALPAAIGPGDYELRALNSLGSVAATAHLSVQSAPTIRFDPNSGPPGTSVQVTVENLRPGILRIDFDGQTVLGPLNVRGTEYSGRILVPANPKSLDGETTERLDVDESIRVAVINLAGDRIIGRGNSVFLRQVPDPAPDYALR